MGYKNFTSSVLLAADVNDYLMEQAVMVFVDATARSTALTAPAAGMVTYLTGLKVLNTYNGTNWVAVAGDPIGDSKFAAIITMDIGV